MNSRISTYLAVSSLLRNWERDPEQHDDDND